MSCVQAAADTAVRDLRRSASAEEPAASRWSVALKPPPRVTGSLLSIGLSWLLNLIENTLALRPLVSSSRTGRKAKLRPPCV